MVSWIIGGYTHRVREREHLWVRRPRTCNTCKTGRVEVQQAEGMGRDANNLLQLERAEQAKVIDVMRRNGIEVPTFAVGVGTSGRGLSPPALKRGRPCVGPTALGAGSRLAMVCPAALTHGLYALTPRRGRLRQLRECGAYARSRMACDMVARRAPPH